MIKLKLLSIFFVFSLSNILYAEIVKKIEISGNNRVNSETIEMFSNISIGDDISSDDLNNSLKDLYETNFFEDVNLILNNSTLIIRVKENMIIQNLIVSGVKNKTLNEKIIDTINIKAKSPFVESKIKQDLVVTKELLQQSGFYFSEVNLSKKINDNNTIDLIFDINLGEKAFINEIIFTGSGTEANNIVLWSLAHLEKKHVITSAIEHPAILKVLETIAPLGVTFTVLSVDEFGQVNPEDLRNSIQSDTGLISIMMVNNEVGTINPMKSLIKVAQSKGIPFHSDTVQSIAYFDIDVKKLQIDFLSCSAHKFHGPKGIGFLYASEKLNLSGYILGGNQEKGLRGGTENTVAVIGLEKALLNSRRNVGFRKLSELKQYLISELEENNFDYSINGSLNSSPSILNISFKTKKDMSMLLFNLDLEGVAISGGSACTSGSNIGSHVLKHIGTSMDYPAIRISFSTLNNKDEINQLVAIFKKLLHK